MGNDVFANGRELSCKAGSGKSICCFPDVCFTPPQTPATPPGVPIPYPNTGMSSDTSKGSRDVKITKKEVMLKNKSAFKKSVGDQAGCAPKKGVVTSKTGGKVYFNAWSMDVKIEGENAVRHLDLTTHNHGSAPGNTPPWPFMDSMAIDVDGKSDDPCQNDKKKEEEACDGYKPNGDKDPCSIVKYAGFEDGRTKSSMTKEEATGMTRNARSRKKLTPPPEGEKYQASAQNCLTARTCQLVPYKPKEDDPACCPSQTGHHLVEASSFFETGRGDTVAESEANILSVGVNGDEKYDTGAAPCICAFGPSQWRGSHGQLHTIQGNLNKKAGSDSPGSLPKKNGGPASVKTIEYGKARDNGVAAAKKVNPKADCSDDCMKAQLDHYHKEKLNVDDKDKIKCVGTGRTSDESVARVEAEVSDSEVLDP